MEILAFFCDRAIVKIVNKSAQQRHLFGDLKQIIIITILYPGLTESEIR